MPRTRRQPVRQFEAATEDGETFTVVEFQTSSELVSGGQSHWAKAQLDYELADGRDVSPADKIGEKFKIVDTDQIIRKVS